MTIKKTLAILFFLTGLIFFQSLTAQAQISSEIGSVEQEEAFEKASGLSAASSAPEIVAIIISLALSLLGIIFVALIIYAGFTWMTAQGDESKVEKAKNIIIAAVIGIIITISAYIITHFVFSSLNDITYGL